jgi:hypothetical protein
VIFAYLAILAFYGGLMISRRLTATIAIPLCALSIAAAALFPVALAQGFLAYANAMMQEVLEPGIVRLSTWVFAVILGAVLAAQMRINGAAERVVRYTAEYAGEDCFRLGLSMLLVIALLFTTLGGLGAVILVATICLPVLFSLGIERRVAGGIFLLGLSLGGALNPTNWQGYKDVLASLDVPAAMRLDLSNIITFAVSMALLFLAVATVFILHQLSDRRHVVRNLIGLFISAAALGGLAWLIADSASLTSLFMKVLATSIGLLIVLLLGLLLLRCCMLPITQSAQSWTGRSDNWLAAASLLIPILLLLWTNLQQQLNPDTPIVIGILAALSIGIIFCSLSSLTHSGRGVNQLMQALFEGVTQAAPAIILLIGIGMLLKATMLPDVLSSFAPVFAGLPLGSPIAFVACFFLLSPLALYRGPLNLYGMGFGIMGILSGAGVLHGSLIMAAFFSVGMLQGVCDPTNTHNVWIANFCKVPVNDLTRLLFPWVSTIVLLGLIAGAVMFHGNFAN